MRPSRKLLRSKPLLKARRSVSPTAPRIPQTEADSETGTALRGHSYDADTGQIFGEIAYPLASSGFAFEPFAGLAYVNVDTERFREKGLIAALNGAGSDEDVGYSTLGLRAATTMHWGSTLLVPKVSAAWQHAFDDVTPGAALSFASTGIGFGITGVPLAEDSLLVEAGLDFALSHNATLGASYSGQLADDVSDNAVKGRLTWLF